MTYVLLTGSAARGDQDRFSDRDVVIVGKGVNFIQAIRLHSACGSSIVSFGEEKFRFLASKGSLFTKHVIGEGRLVSGSASGWGEIAKSWSSDGCYGDEIESNRRLLAVLQAVPSSSYGNAAALDIMVCSVRNILIRELASRGIFEFAWNSVMKCSSRVFPFPTGFDRAIRIARTHKNLRRSGARPSVSSSEVQEFAEIFGRVLGVRRIGWTRSNRTIERVAAQFESGSYAQLRAYELLCANAPSDPGFAALRSIVRRPAYFSISERMAR